MKVGLPLVEAMKFGKPVCTSNIASMPEVAASAALLVDPNDTRQISQAMVQMVTDLQLYSNLSSNSIKGATDFQEKLQSICLIVSILCKNFEQLYIRILHVYKSYYQKITEECRRLAGIL